VVLDHQNRVHGHQDAGALGSEWRPPDGLAPLPGGTSPSSREALLRNRELFVAEAPVTDLRGRAIGRALVGMPSRYLDDLLQASRRQLVLLLGLAIVADVILTFLLMSYLLRPIAVLRGGIERIGRGDLDVLIRLRDRTELGMLADTVNDMTRALKKAQGEMIERERLAHEIGLARRLQQSLLPREPLQTDPFLVRGSQRPAAEVGGDYYDFLPLLDGRIAIAVADVAGKGLQGCLIMTMLSALMRAFRDVHKSPAAMLATLDERLGETLEVGSFVTMFYGLLDPVRGELTFSSAGHNPLFLYRAESGRVERLASPGIPLGSIHGGAAKVTFRDQQLRLGPGDLMVQYTDGYNEALNPNKRQFGIENMERVVTEHGAGGAESVIQALERAVHEWTGNVPYDDETLLVVEHRAPESQRGPRDGLERTAERTVEKANGNHEALHHLEAAVRAGHRIELTARIKSLGSLLEWIGRTPVLKDLRGGDAKVLATALYEACANIAEHGFGQDPTCRFSLWWVPAELPGAADAGAQVRAGRFVILDDGRPFRPDNWRETDFNDPSVWKRQRGFGLDIIHRAMCEVTYSPGTVRGNITVLQYGPRETPMPQETPIPTEKAS
jgi:serine phosphatase RsbU (regulator of sigma subunit)